MDDVLKDTALHKRNPREYDLVLGGNNPPPIDGVVLGGIAGVERRLSSHEITAKLDAVTEALKYGDEGIELIINALQDSSEEFCYSAARILKQQDSLDAKQALLDYDPYLFFTTLKDWNHIRFNPEVGISNPIKNAYILDLEIIERHLGLRQRGIPINHNLDLFNSLLQQPQANQIEALICQIEWDRWNEHKQFGFFLEAICDAKEQLPNLKALFIGDREEHQFRKSKIDVFELQPVLEAYPNLEVLQVRGRFSENPLESEDLKHENLKTLIIETVDLSDYNLAEICSLNLPELEYLEIWLGRQIEDAIISLHYILDYDSFPKLKYLGLKSSNHSDRIVEALVDSPILEHLYVLDLSMGTLTDNGVEPLITCAENIEQLHTLDISENAVSEGAIAYLSELYYNLIADNQADYPYYCHRYYTLYE